LIFGQYRFLLSPSKFVFHVSFNDPTVHSVDTETVIKLPTIKSTSRVVSIHFLWISRLFPFLIKLRSTYPLLELLSTLAFRAFSPKGLLFRILEMYGNSEIKSNTLLF
jgi:hypothetical protein